MSLRRNHSLFKAFPPVLFVAAIDGAAVEEPDYVERVINAKMQRANGFKVLALAKWRIK